METERPRMTRSKSQSRAAAAAEAEVGEDRASSAENVNGEVGPIADEIDARKRDGDADDKVDGIEGVQDEDDKVVDKAQRDKSEDGKADKEEVDAMDNSPEVKKKGETENVEDEQKEEKLDKELNGSQKQSPEAPETPQAALGRGRRSRILNVNLVRSNTEDIEKSGESTKTTPETKPKQRGRKRKVVEVPETETGEKNVNESKEKDEEETTNQRTEEHNESQKTESTDSMDPDLDLPPKQTFGKGKRARIPNRKYGDIPVTPKSTVSENGSEKIKSDSESLDFSSQEESSGIYSGGTLSQSPSGNTPQPKKPKFTNLKDPKYLKPFEYGWKRELVFRGTSDSKLKRNADVYYFSPDKKKVRSMREVVENLKNKMLSVDNFTFFKEAIGLNDPEKEIIRSAAKRTSTPTLPDKEVAHKAEPLAKGRKVVKSPSQKAMSPQVSSPKVTSPKLTLVDEEMPELKVKLPTKKSVKRTEKEDENTEAVTTPTTPSKAGSTKTAGKAAKSRTIKRARLSVSTVSAPPIVEDTSGGQPINHFQNLAYGYNTLLQVFQYLKVQDLLRAGCVCTMWRDVMSNPTLWRTVRMKNSQVHSFEGLANTLKKHCTRHLDLRKVLLPNGGDEIWPEFSKAIEKVDTLKRIELCRCPASVVEKLAVSNPQLEVLNAVTIKCETLDLTPFKSLAEVKELRLKSTTGFTISSNLDSLKEMKSLVHLSLTSVKELDKMNLSTIAELTELESLDLGECTDFPKEFGEKILVKLTKLEKLRLEKGQGNCYTFEILEAVRSMPKLEQLELVNFDIKAGFDKALGACQNIKKLLLIPTYISQSATTNHMLLGGVVRLQNSLTHFVWGVTLELLRVTELFIDQCEELEKKERKEVKSGGGAGDFIPVLKPTPLIREKDAEIPPAYDPPQVEIFHLTRLQKLLMMNLPTTRVKILKIPFHATWRQSITDSVN